jgi:hypothetical protein
MNLHLCILSPVASMTKLMSNNEKTLTKCLFLIKNKAYPIMEISIIDAFSTDQISNLDDGFGCVGHAASQ